MNLSNKINRLRLWSYDRDGIRYKSDSVVFRAVKGSMDSLVRRGIMDAVDRRIAPVRNSVWDQVLEDLKE